MKTFSNVGCGECVLLWEENNVALIAAVEKDEYVVANGLQPNGTWHFGEYFKSLSRAMTCFKKRTQN